MLSYKERFELELEESGENELVGQATKSLTPEFMEDQNV